MKISDWSFDELAEIDGVFDRLLDVPDKVRAAELDEFGRRRPALADAVRELFRAMARPDARLEPGAIAGWTLWPALAGRQPRRDGLPAGSRIGAYRVTESLARGGMADVYLAERADGAFEQRVAIKLLPGILCDPWSVRQFEQERQILADLVHPHIARLLDGGTNGDGRPYLVMEYIDGVPIDRHADERRLDLAARLDVFLQAARAVQFAHRHLVVHGDLKPSNILVTRDGEVKLLDFGIARLLGVDDPKEAGRPPSAHVLRRLTPAYASPEQWRGDAVTVASDVYQLGLLLFELLSGLRVSDVRGRSASPATSPPLASAVLEAVRGPDGIAGAVVRRTTPVALAGSLRGDLDAILARSLQPEVAARYGSVDELVEDLARCRDGWPVRARPATRAYRVGKFVRRHRLGVGAAASFAILTTGFGVTAAVQASQLARERDRANQTASRAEQVAGFLSDVFEISAPERSLGRQVSARELLDRGARRVDLLSAEPELQASLLDVMGRVYGSHGAFAAALPLLERAAAQRRAIADVSLRDMAATLHHLGVAYYNSDQLDAADRTLQEALALRQSALGPEDPDVADSLLQLGRLEFRRDRMDAAMTRFLDALALRARVFGDDDPSTAEPRMAITLVLTRQRKFAEAEPIAREAYASASRSGVPTPDLADAAVSLGMVVHNLGRLDEAATYYRQALDVRTTVLGPDHPDTIEPLNNLAVLEYARDEYAKAEPLLQRVVDAARRVLPPGHGLLPNYLFNLAGAQLQLERLDQAERNLREALEIRHRLYGDAHSQVVATMGQLATVLHERGTLGEARALFVRAIAGAHQAATLDRSALSTVLVAYGELLLTESRLPDAERTVQEAIALRKAQFGERHWRVSAAESTLGAIRLAERRWRDAEALLVPAADVLRGAIPNNRVTRRAFDRVAALYTVLRRPVEVARYEALRPRGTRR